MRPLFAQTCACASPVSYLPDSKLQEVKLLVQNTATFLSDAGCFPEFALSCIITTAPEIFFFLYTLISTSCIFILVRLVGEKCLFILISFFFDGERELF